MRVRCTLRPGLDHEDRGAVAELLEARLGLATGIVRHDQPVDDSLTGSCFDWSAATPVPAMVLDILASIPFTLPTQVVLHHGDTVVAHRWVGGPRECA